MNEIGKKLSIIVDESVQKLGRQIVSRGARAANEMRNAELEVLRGKRSGKIYRKPGTKTMYRASAPGEPPASRSGNLRQHWRKRVKAETKDSGMKVIACLESEHDYSAYLDEGTSSMEPRPYKDKIIEKAMPRIEDIYKEPYN